MNHVEIENIFISSDSTQIPYMVQSNKKWSNENQDSS